MKSGETLTGVQVIVSNQVTTVSGQLADDKGARLADGTVIVFADEAPGDYLAIAVDWC